MEDRVDFAICGEDALELVNVAETNGMRYCLILTDISMP